MTRDPIEMQAEPTECQHRRWTMTADRSITCAGCGLSYRAPQVPQPYIADVPDDLRPVEIALVRYGEWAKRRSGRGGAGETVDRWFRPENDSRESYDSWMRRCMQAPRDVIIPTPIALSIQAAMGDLIYTQRTVLQLIYVGYKDPAVAILSVLKISAMHSRELHIKGLRRLDKVLRDEFAAALELA